MVSSDLEVVSEKFTGAQEGHQRPRLINRNRTATKYVTPKLNKVNGVLLSTLGKQLIILIETSHSGDKLIINRFCEFQKQVLRMRWLLFPRLTYL